ncbi:preprotein translocase subunit YajC [Secundilactobacillus kimchicus]|uniref:preprotein translocase subunit YajC n=1 Tax=Secundilactobacillus kimchicus TaxID=528209 RepID=UPI0009E92075|nr:preprotein translocase subunit YajC [Secundilactobacillus kimchicus]MBT9671703.1 preprotein translocase subunit YajC [Secundilactobacillus kimchicus]
MNILAGAGASSYSGIILIVVMIVAMYFLMIRPQRKQQQKHQSTLSQLQKGDHVITIGRLHGVVDEINREAGTVTLDCDGIYLVFDLNAIATVNQKTAVPETASDSAATETPSASSQSTEPTTESAEPADSAAPTADDNKTDK